MSVSRRSLRLPQVHFEDQIRAARKLYDSLLINGELPKDKDLARSSQYQALLSLGRRIRANCDLTTFIALCADFSDDDQVSSRTSQQHLAYLWAGLETAGDWSRFAFEFDGKTLSRKHH